MKRVFYTKKFLNKAAKAMGATIDKQIQDVLGGKEIITKAALLNLTMRLKRKIRQWRIELAEKIAGENLHEYCNDW